MRRCLLLLTVTARFVLSSGAADVIVSLADDGDVLNGAEAATAAALVVRTGEEEYRLSVPLGEWYDVTPVTVNKNGVQTLLNRRTMRMDAATYRGQLNILLNRLKAENPDREIYLVTPIADSSSALPNAAGALPGDYAAAVREAGNVWAVTVVDLAGAAPVTLPVREGLFHSAPDATNRPPASVSGATVGCVLDSRREQSAVSLGVPFFSDARNGFSLILM